MARLIGTVVIIGIALMCVYAEDLYSSQYDDIDVKAILQNDKKRNEYVQCFMGTGSCITSDAKFFKKIFSEAFTTKCKKCTEKQKQHMDLIADWFKKNKPDEWQSIVAKTVEDMKQKNARK